MLFYVILAIIFKITYTQHFEIEDIPIEQFEHDDAVNDAIDVELMPRSSRSLFLDRDLKEPSHHPIDIESYIRADILRHKRDVGQSDVAIALSKEKKELVEGLGKPLELSEIEAESVSEKPIPRSDAESSGGKDEINFLINDFIRFKRSTEQDSLNEESGEETKVPEKDSSGAKSPSQSQKMVMNPTQKDQKDNTRETRGATKEQWVKQTYPVRRSDDISYDEAMQSADSIHAPRVHFVTQGMAEAASERSYNREARDGEFRKPAPDGEFRKPAPRTLDRDMYSDMGYYQPRYTRNYDPVSYRQPRYFDPRYNYDPRERIQYRPYESPERFNNYPVDNKRQRRIIYYATLPDIPRPPNADLRERYDYRDRDRYNDDRYSPDPYRYRKGYVKPRYEEREMEKTPYPVKVSTDVNVREVKKNPETRIYSDVDRNRFAQPSRT